MKHKNALLLLLAALPGALLAILLTFVTLIVLDQSIAISIALITLLVAVIAITYSAVQELHQRTALGYFVTSSTFSALTLATSIFSVLLIVESYFLTGSVFVILSAISGWVAVTTYKKIPKEYLTKSKKIYLLILVTSTLIPVIAAFLRSIYLASLQDYAVYISLETSALSFAAIIVLYVVLAQLITTKLIKRGLLAFTLLILLVLGLVTGSALLYDSFEVKDTGFLPAPEAAIPTPNNPITINSQLQLTNPGDILGSKVNVLNTQNKQLRIQPTITCEENIIDQKSIQTIPHNISSQDYEKFVLTYQTLSETPTGEYVCSVQALNTQTNESTPIKPAQLTITVENKSNK